MKFVKYDGKHWLAHRGRVYLDVSHGLFYLRRKDGNPRIGGLLTPILRWRKPQTPEWMETSD